MMRIGVELSEEQGASLERHKYTHWLEHPNRRYQCRGGAVMLQSESDIPGQSSGIVLECSCGFKTRFTGEEVRRLRAIIVILGVDQDAPVDIRTLRQINFFRVMRAKQLSSSLLKRFLVDEATIASGALRRTQGRPTRGGLRIIDGGRQVRVHQRPRRQLGQQLRAVR